LRPLERRGMRGAMSDDEKKDPEFKAHDTGKRVDPSQLGGAKPIRRESRDQKKPQKREPEIYRRGPPTAVKPLPAETTEGSLENAATIEGAPASDATTVERPMVERQERQERRPRRDDRRHDKPRGPREGPREDFAGMQPIVVETGDVGDFASMLAQTGPIDRKDVRVGDKVRATCVHIGTDTVFFELSRTQEAHAPAAEFLDDDGNLKLRTGDRIDAFVISLSEGILLSTKLGKDQIDVGMLEQAKASGIPVSGTVTGVNKGGIEVQIAGTARGFCPLGQIDVGFVDDPQSLIGKTLEFLVREVKENGRNILLSRRALVEKQKKEAASKTMATLSVGALVKGTVSRLQPFGAFVDIGGVDGLIPLSELGWGHVKDPGEVLKVGDLVSVEVRKIEPDPKREGQTRISLSLKATQQDPFIAHLDDMSPGSWHVGVVKKLETFGAFVELWPGVQGLVHISEIADRRIAHPKDVLNVDEQVKIRVIDVDEVQRRISLSLKEAAPEIDDVTSPERPAGKRVQRGQSCEGVVDRVEKFGVFLKLDAPPELAGQSAFMPASETGTQRGTDLHKAFPLATKLQVLIIDVDDRGRLKVSKTAREQAEERAVVDQYKSDKKGQAGFGTLGDLLKQKMSK
jgi:small subunit ribosomal protein S1